MNGYGRIICVTYTRNYTYSQGRSLKFMIGFLRKLGVQHDIRDLVLNKTQEGQPGYPDTYRVRIRYKHNEESL